MINGNVLFGHTRGKNSVSITPAVQVCPASII
jgi:hypothetical protein